MSSIAVSIHKTFLLLFLKFTHGHPTAKVDKTSVFWDRPFPNKLVIKHKQIVTVKHVKNRNKRLLLLLLLLFLFAGDIFRLVNPLETFQQGEGGSPSQYSDIAQK